METVTGPLNGVPNSAVALTVAGYGAVALNFTEAEGLRVDRAGVRASASTSPGDLARTNAGSGEEVGGVGEGVDLSAEMDARGSKQSRVRCSSI